MSRENQQSCIFIISGPSGAGEDSVIEGLRKYFEIERVITTTTRPKRPGESWDNPYYFISRDEFEKRIINKEFIEWTEQYNGNLYGVTEDEVERVRKSGKVGIWKIDWQGVVKAKKIYPEIKAILITVSNIKILEERIRRRGGLSEQNIQERMSYSREWLKHVDIYDFMVFNEEGELEKAIFQTAKIVRDICHL